MPRCIFAVTARDHLGAAQKRADLRPEHLRWIESLAGDLMMGGPLRKSPDGPVIGSQLFIAATDEAALRALLAEDPYARGGLFASVDIARFQPVAGAWLT